MAEPSTDSSPLVERENKGSSETNEEKHDLDKLSYFGYTRKQFRTIIIFGIANLFVSSLFSLQAPFYPKEAEAKGATATEYGLVLGIFHLVGLVTFPTCGSIIGTYFDPKKVFNFGILCASTAAVLFGFLDFIDDRVTFIGLSFVLRIFQAIGEAAFVTASFTSIPIDFPESVAATFATFETCCGIGFIIGPSLGGFLYELGGFPLPFWFTGGSLLLVSIVAYFFLPDCGKKATPSSDTDEFSGSSNIPRPRKTGYISMLRIKSVALAFFGVLITASSAGFLVATLEPHLRENFGLTPGQTGLIFIIDGGVYAIAGPIWGKIVDKSSHDKVFTIIGACLTFSGFLLVGPAPFIPLQTTLWLICIGLVLHGLGMGASFISAFTQAGKDSVANGFEDNVATHALISALWLCAYAAGAFVGPSIGGILLDHFGFKYSTIYVLASQTLVAILTLLFLCTSKKRKPSESSLDEKEGLISGAEAANSRGYGTTENP